MPRHEHTHYKASTKHCDVHRMKKRVVYVLRTAFGGMWLGGTPPEDYSVCTTYRPRLVTTQVDRVTCPRCQEYIRRFVTPKTVNPRSGMRMPLAERYEKT